MRNEILTGIFGGLFIITLFVLAGSFIGAATSHGPKEAHAETVKTVPQTEDGSGKTDPAVKTDGKTDGIEALDEDTKEEIPKTDAPAAVPGDSPTP